MKFKTTKIIRTRDKDIFYWSQTRWLWGLLSLKIWHPYQTFMFRLLGLPLFYSKQKNEYLYYKILGIPFLRLNAAKRFFKNFCTLLHELYPQYDDFYIFMSKSGEFYLLMHHFAAWVLRNNSKNYVCVFFNNYHADLYKLFFPNHKFIQIKGADVVALSRGVEKIKTIFGSCNFYAPLYEKYFRQVEANIRNNQAHYYQELLRHLDLEHTSSASYVPSNTIKEKVNKILPLLNHKFILISPESGSNTLLSKNFWKEIYTYIKSLGYEVFCNCTDMKSFIAGSTCIFLNYGEIMELAKHATLIIGLRSGLLECMESSKVPLIVLYSDFPKRNGFKFMPSAQVREGFSLKKLNCLGNLNVKEYDLNKLNERKLLQQCKSDILDVINMR